MILIGEKEWPGEEAEKRFPGAYAAWRMEVRNGCWPDWPSMHRHYPKASRLDGGVVHFPLARDGGGIACAVSFKPGVVRLLHISRSPLAARPLSPSHPKHQPHASKP
jgi:hypothetical protein